MSTAIVYEANTGDGRMSWDERRGFVRGDRRQIQTAVLGGADSDEPLMLPLEAIELDAFRRRHEHDTFWCGLLLGGCGLQLTTKLYTDRVCHFAHHPGSDGHPHLCGRRARGVSSADHLYVKSAAAAWLRSRDQQADVEFVQPEGAPIGSVVEIRFPRGGLRVHLDQTVEPSWDQVGCEPVLGVSVPVDRDTLIDRWYVHRIRLDSEGTARRVHIGTEAFARETEWFTLDQCEMTERGLSTPAVEQIVRSRSTRPVAQWNVGTVRKVPDAHARAKMLLRKLTDAIRVDVVVDSGFVVTEICRDIANLTGVGEEMEAQLAAAVSDAERWLEKQSHMRSQLFSELDDAIVASNLVQVRTLRKHLRAVAHHDRTDTENETMAAAEALLKAHAKRQQDAAAARRAKLQDERAAQAAGRAHKLLGILERREGRLSPEAMRKLVNEVVNEASQAGARIDSHQQDQINAWKKRADSSRARPQTARRAATSARTVAQAAGKAQPPAEAGHKEIHRRPLPQSLSWSVLDVSCPACDAPAGMHCTPNSLHPHQRRLEWFRRRFPNA
ncbi:hypothetical protein [Streptomyces griseoruber]|uniref:hypothetical protein n=1 Tax=Streptomyces griseoruber TaxID=1943 RepID=UPI001F0A1101|nr:hypothetical protein [Streptomyces griseoruber]